MWAGLAMLLQAHLRDHICDTPNARIEHVGAQSRSWAFQSNLFHVHSPFR